MAEEYGEFIHQSQRLPRTLVIASETALGRDSGVVYGRLGITRAVCVSREEMEEWTLNPATGEVTGYRNLPRLREGDGNPLFAELQTWAPFAFLGVLIIVFSLIIVQSIRERTDHTSASTTDEWKDAP